MRGSRSFETKPYARLAYEVVRNWVIDCHKDGVNPPLNSKWFQTLVELAKYYTGGAEEPHEDSATVNVINSRI